MQLQFIDHGSLGPVERKRIRSHVMKGKNAGRPRPSRKRQPVRQRVQCPDVHDTAPVHPEDWCEVQEYTRTLALKPLLWDDFALTSFPQPLSSRSRALLHKWFLAVGESLYPPELCTKFTIFDSVWVYCIFLDDAYFHSMLALLASFAGVWLGDARITPEALDHITKAYYLVNKRLSGEGAVSDATIAVVTTLAIYQRIHQQHSTGLIHFHGLTRMIELRGGMAKVSRANRPLALKPWRLDLEFALQNGSPPRFRADEMPCSSFLSGLRKSQLVKSVPQLLDSCNSVDAKLLTFFHEVNRFTGTINAKKLDPLDYSEAVLLYLHRLIEFAPLGGDRPTEGLDNLVHLALLALMTGLLPGYGPSFSRYDLLSTHLERAFHDFAFHHSGTRKPMILMVWALFVGGITVLDSRSRPWLLALLVETCEALELNSWYAVQEAICEYPWIDAVHARSGKALWEAVELFQERGTF